MGSPARRDSRIAGSADLAGAPISPSDQSAKCAADFAHVSFQPLKGPVGFRSVNSDQRLLNVAVFLKGGDVFFRHFFQLVECGAGVGTISRQGRERGIRDVIPRKLWITS